MADQFLLTSCMIVGGALGLLKGGKRAARIFQLENGHRAPKTKAGWYFYWKSKNYNVAWAGTKSAVMTSIKFGACALVWISSEHAVSWGREKIGFGLKDVKYGPGIFDSSITGLIVGTLCRRSLLGLAIGAMRGAGVDAYNQGLQAKLEEQVSPPAEVEDI